VIEGYTQKITLPNMTEWKNIYLSYLASSELGQKLTATIKKEGVLSDDTIKVLHQVAKAVETNATHLFMAESE